MHTNATKHYDRDAFETNNSSNDLHGHGVNQLDQNNFVNTPHYNRDDYESYNHPKFSNQALVILIKRLIIKLIIMIQDLSLVNVLLLALLLVQSLAQLLDF